MTPYQQILTQMHSSQRTRKYVERHFPDELDAIEAKPGRSWVEKLYLYLHDMNEIPKCPICGNLVNLEKFNKGYYTFCSQECAYKDPNRKNKFKETCLERYGVEAPMQSNAIRKKSSQTCIRKYGVEHANKSQTVKDKISKSNRLSHSTEEYRRNYRKSMLTKYGVESYPQSKEFKEKYQATCLERYGTTHPMKSQEIKSRLISTNLNRYGVINAAQLISRRNFPELINSDGGRWVCKCPHPECNECEEKTYITTRGVHDGRLRCNAELCTKLHPINDHRSTAEYIICGMLDELGVKYEISNRTVIAPQEIDIYIPELKLGVEVNGCYWHSEIEKPKNYHFNKWLQAKFVGVKLIFIWEDWVENYLTCVQNLLYYHIYGGEVPNIAWDSESIDDGIYDINLISEHQIVPAPEFHNGYKCWTVGKIINNKNH